MKSNNKTMLYGEMVNFNKVAQNLNKRVQKALHNIGKDIKKTVIKNAKQLKTGIKYPDLKYRSSAPNETSRWQTGELAKSFDMKVSTNLLTTGFTAPHSIEIEYGRRNMKPRKDGEKAVRMNFNNITCKIKNASEENIIKSVKKYNI